MLMLTVVLILRYKLIDMILMLYCFVCSLNIMVASSQYGTSPDGMGAHYREVVC